MSRFYASVTGKRSTITKCGHKDGLNSHLRGWTKGVRVNMWYNEETKTEHYTIEETAGSNGDTPTKLIHTMEVKCL